MTDLRTAAQRALEALELGYDSAKAEADQYHAAMAGYRPQHHAQMDADVQQIAAAITALKAALAEPVQEPVAWMYHGIRHDGTPHDRASLIWRPEYMDVMSADKGAKATPLYAAPPQRKPLTRDEAMQLVNETAGAHWCDEAHLQRFRAAIERAHGIEETK